MVDQDQFFRKSSYSELECVEVGQGPGGTVTVRHSREREGACVVFSGQEWSAFIAGAKNGEFDFAPVSDPGD